MDAFLEMLTQKAQPDLDWTYALITLVFRFFAVFVVLWLIQVGMQVSAFLIRRSERREGGGATGGTAGASAAVSATGGDADGPDALTAAAIGLALELESQPEAVRIASDRTTSAWSWAGRTRQLRNPPR